MQQRATRGWPGGTAALAGYGVTPGTVLIGLGLAERGRDGKVTWNDKGRAIADTAGVHSGTLLVLEAEAISSEVESDLEEAGRW